MSEWPEIYILSQAGDGYAFVFCVKMMIAGRVRQRESVKG
jgi:hypothetical protein